MFEMCLTLDEAIWLRKMLRHYADSTQMEIRRFLRDNDNLDEDGMTFRKMIVDDFNIASEILNKM